MAHWHPKQYVNHPILVYSLIIQMLSTPKATLFLFALAKRPIMRHTRTHTSNQSKKKRKTKKNKQDKSKKIQCLHTYGNILFELIFPLILQFNFKIT